MRVALITLVAALLTCFLLSRLAVWFRDELAKDAMPSDEWTELDRGLGGAFGVETTPLPLSGRSQCWGVQDVTCTALLHYTAPDAKRVLEHNHFTLGELRPTEPSPGAWGRVVKKATVEGLTPLKLNERHHAERSMQWYELEDGTVELSVSYFEL